MGVDCYKNILTDAKPMFVLIKSEYFLVIICIIDYFVLVPVHVKPKQS